MATPDFQYYQPILQEREDERTRRLQLYQLYMDRVTDRELQAILDKYYLSSNKITKPSNT